MDEIDGLNELKKLVVELANDNYKEEGTGLLLSRLGQTITQRYSNLRHALGSRKLADFIEAELAGALQILTSPENRIVKVVLPANVTIDGDVMRFIPKRDVMTRPVETPRYNRAFWAAFSQPLAEDRIRLIGFEPQVHFEDIEGAVPPAATAKKEVSRDLVTDEATEPDPAKRVRRIVENIRQWLNTNGVGIDIVIAKAASEQIPEKASTLRKGSLLEILLEALGEADLKRIQMPLDVVAKLHHRL